MQAAVALLEGFEAPAAAWETEILPARIAAYEPAWLDDQCLAGRITWARLAPGHDNSRDHVASPGRDRGATPIRTTPITLLVRRHAQFWTSLAGPANGLQPSRRAQTVLGCLHTQGASFFDELTAASGLLPSQVEEALAELVTLGPGHVGQLRRVARAAGTVRSTQAVRRRNKATADHQLRHGRCGPVGADAPFTIGSSRTTGQFSVGRTRGAHPSAPLRRGVLALACARSRLVATVARPAARVSPPGGARRNSWRPLRRRLFR